MPSAVEPRRYELHLSPDLESRHLHRLERIEIEVLEATDAVVLNANELEISDASISSGWASEGAPAAGAPARRRRPSASSPTMTTRWWRYVQVG